MKTDTDIGPITVDTKAIASGLYEMFDEDERACLAFGLLPADKLGVLRQALANAAPRFWLPTEAVFSAEELSAFAAVGFDVAKGNEERVRDARARWVSQTEHEVCLALYRVAPMVV